jgi:hypothetical protein
MTAATRFRLAVAAAPLLAILHGSWSGCASDPMANQRPCRFEVERTVFLGSIWNDAHAKASIVSQDGGESFAVPGGALWAFGDTFRGTRSTDGAPHFQGGAVSCSIALLKANATGFPPAFDFFVSRDGSVASPFEYFPDESAERNRIWPLGGAWVNGRFYLYYSMIEVFGSGSWDFRGVGTGLARSDAALGKYERLRPGGQWRFPVEPSQILETEGWLYLFGIGDVGGRKCVTLARVRPPWIERPESYEFFNGEEFSGRRESAAALVEDISGQVSVAWNDYLGKYVMATSSDVSNPRDIFLRVADTPTGPWSPAVARIQVPETRQGKRVSLVYCAYLHPERFRGNGKVIVLTFSPGLEDAGFDGNCEMVEIELRRLD